MVAVRTGSSQPRLRSERRCGTSAMTLGLGRVSYSNSVDYLAVGVP